MMPLTYSSSTKSLVLINDKVLARFMASAENKGEAIETVQTCGRHEKRERISACRAPLARIS